MPKLPDILRSRVVARSRLFQVEQRELRFDNGVTVDYERIPGRHIGAVLVVPVLGDDTWLLVREYAAGTHSYELGFPKGRVEAGEDLLEGANRELMEEIGHGARRLTPLTTLTIAPGYIGHRTHIILAQDLYPRRLAGDEPEELEVVPWRFADLDRLLAREDLTEARSIAALFLSLRHLKHGEGP